MAGCLYPAVIGHIIAEKIKFFIYILNYAGELGKIALLIKF